MSEERLAFRAEVARLLDLVVHSLYSEKEIFLRELISNASDACDKLRYDALTQPELTDEDPDFKIMISADPKDRTLTITDNGIGMTRDELVENLGTIARSGTSEFLKKMSEKPKEDMNMIGQFGVGFYAAFMVAQMVEVTSRRAGSEEAFCWRSDGRGEFAVEEAEKESRGTEIKIYLKQGEDEFLETERLKHIIHLYSDHIAIPVFLNDSESPSNRASALWLRSKADITEDQYKEFYHHVGHGFDDPAVTMHWKAEGTIEYNSLLFIPTQKPFDLFDPKRSHGVKLYVRRVFITNEAEGLIAPYLRFLRGVVDSEDLPLNISREMLQNNPMLSKIKQGITRRVLSELQTLGNDKDAYSKFWESFGAVLKEGIYEDSENREKLLKLMRCHSTEADGLVSLDDYIARMKQGQEAIYYINGENMDALLKSPHLEGFRARGVEVLLLTDTVDDFWTGTVEAYGDKKFQSVTRASQDLSKITPTENKEQDDKPAASDDDMNHLTALMKLVLKDKVKDVKPSNRLTESAVCLVADENDLDLHLEHFLKQHKQLNAYSPRILEVNAKHPLILKMAKNASEDGALDKMQDVVLLLLDQARLMGGETLPDPSDFTKRLGDVLTKTIS